MRAIMFLFALLSLPAMAQDCLVESEAFFNLVAVKWSVNAGIEKAPEQFKGEKWLYVWGGSGSIFEEKEISEEKAMSMARLVAENDFSQNPEVEINIFEDYWFLSCESEAGRNEMLGYSIQCKKCDEGAVHDF